MSGQAALLAGGSLLGGALDFFSAERTNQANLEAQRELIAAQAANQERALNSLTGTSDFQDVTRAGGGFDITQLGGPEAAQARAIGSAGDVFSAERIANARTGFDFNLPDLDAARASVSQDVQDTQKNFDNVANDVIEAQRRNFGGINNTNEVPAILDSLRDASREFNFGTEGRALQRLGDSNRSDLGTLQSANAAFAPTNPPPPFQSAAGVGGQAANAIISSPPPPSPVNFGNGALAAGAASSTLSNLFNQQQARTANQGFLDAISRLGNSQGPGSFGGGGNTATSGTFRDTGSLGTNIGNF
jgi:hypothetical protein